MIVFEESGMHFGPFAPEDCFKIEHSAFFKKLENIKAVEFVLAKQVKNKNYLYFVEAKSSIPNLSNSNSDSDVKKKSFEYVKKFSDSLLVYLSLLLKRFPKKFDNDLPYSPKFSLEALSQQTFIFLLVVKSSEKQWRIATQEILYREMQSFLSIWQIPHSSSVLVIDEAKAKNLGLVF